MVSQSPVDVRGVSLKRALYVRALLVLLASYYAWLVQFAYVEYISPIFAYQGMVTQVIPASLRAVQLVLAIVPAAWLPLQLAKPSEFQALLLYIVVYVPSVMVGYHITAPARWQGYTVFVVTLAICLVALIQVRHLPPLRMPSVRLTRWQLLWFVAGSCAAIYALLLAYYGLPDNMFDINGIYRARADFKARVLDAPTVVNYLYFWQGVVINPALIIIGLWRRNAVLVFVAVVMQYVLFSITTLRSLLLSVAFSVFVYFFFRTRWRWKGALFLGMMVSAATVGALFMSGEDWVAIAGRIFVQRWLTIQGQLAGAYFDFFSQNQHVYLSDSILRGFLPYQYGNLTPGEVIGDSYVSLGSQTIANATVNFWADAYGQFGLGGVVVATAFAFMVLWIIDSLFKHYPRGAAIMLFSTCALSLTEQGVQTSMLTGGLVPLMILAVVARSSLASARTDATRYSGLQVSP